MGAAVANGVDPARFREVLGAVAAPVTVVTALRDGRPHGTTVSAFCSLSLQPPLVIASLDRGSELLAIVRDTRRFGINVLRQGQEEHALRFARKSRDKFAGLDWEEDRELPRLPGASAWIACRAQRMLPGGDHVIVTGLVEHAERWPEHRPLVYCERAFATTEASKEGER
jgi:flavin reductase (DIM6/NTAB) family NADH-FMN oxidoreductase RutF